MALYSRDSFSANAWQPQTSLPAFADTILFPRKLQVIPQQTQPHPSRCAANCKPSNHTLLKLIEVPIADVLRRRHPHYDHAGHPPCFPRHPSPSLVALPLPRGPLQQLALQPPQQVVRSWVLGFHGHWLLRSLWHCRYGTTPLTLCRAN